MKTDISATAKLFSLTTRQTVSIVYYVLQYIMELALLSTNIIVSFCAQQQSITESDL